MKFYLYLCQNGSKAVPTAIYGLRSSPLNPWILDRFWGVGFDAFKQAYLNVPVVKAVFVCCR
jgi:hypothetical protein